MVDQRRRYLFSCTKACARASARIESFQIRISPVFSRIQKIQERAEIGWRSVYNRKKRRYRHASVSDSRFLKI